MSAAPSVRQRFGRYEVLFPIASGGMAEVYAARVVGEAGFQKLVALKRMRPEMTEDVKFTTMFLDEGRMAANIASPNVVSTLDLGRAEDNSLYLVMELVTGASLAMLLQELHLRQAQVPVGVAIDILCQTANGLHDAHEAKSPAGEPLGIIHRDVSPHNILVDVNGQAKITDFGIAKALERQTKSHAGEMKGKLSYLSPEQARGSDVDRRADIFILGIVAWEVLLGRRLFTGKGPVEVLHKIVTMDVPRVDVERPEIPTAVGDVVEQALARSADGRFRSALAFGNALGHAFGRRLPPRSEVSAFVRNFAGEHLRELEQGIRRAAGGSFDELPAQSDPEYPIPLSKSAPLPAEDDGDDDDPFSDRALGIAHAATVPDEPIADGTVPMSPLDLPEEVRANLAPNPVPTPDRLDAHPAVALRPPKMPEDLGDTMRADSLQAADLDLAPSQARGFPETLPTMERNVETYRPPPPGLPDDISVPAPPSNRLGLKLFVAALVIGILLGGGLLLWRLSAGDAVEPRDSTSAVPPVSVEGSTTTTEPGPDGEDTSPPDPVAPQEVEATDPAPGRRGGRGQPSARRRSTASSRRIARPEPQGDPPSQLPGQTDPIGDRAAAIREIENARGD